ncbi:MAG: aminotransferase class V-fold PLP-dependent enzyme [Phycisphaerae bacterium]|nr:aminotransferase class V-fold PLP-dependent enzyme [Phycisphaerae bacterium]
MTSPESRQRKKIIPYSRPSVSSAEIQEVRKVLRSGWLTTGPAVERFERAFAEKVGARFAVAFSSGTSALVGACAAAGVGSADRFITTTMSFVASANCGRYFGAAADLVDVEEPTLNVSAAAIEQAMRQNTRAVVAVHYQGHPVDLAAISEVCRRRGAVLIEDAAHALGARYRDSVIGDCRYSDLCAFSFHPTKLITTGEGGMVTTNREDFDERLRRFRNHGMVRRPELEPWEYDCPELSFNWRLSDVHSAMGLAQLARSDGLLARRREIAAYYNERFAACDALITPVEEPECLHAYHIYVLRFRYDRLTINRRGMFERLKAASIVPQVHYRPIHRHSQYQALGYEASAFGVAEAAYGQMFSMPMYPDLTQREARYVADTVCRLVEENRRD